MQYRGVLKEYASTWQVVLKAADAAVVALAGWLAAFLYIGGLPSTAGYELGILVSVLLVPILFPAFGLYRAWRGQGVRLELRTLTIAWIALLSMLAVLAFLTKRGPEFSRGWFLIWFTLGWTALAIERIALRSVLGYLRRRGFNQRRIVVIRIDDFGIKLARGLEATPWAGLKVVAMFCARVGACSSDAPPAPFRDDQRDFDGLENLASFVRDEDVDQVWIALPLKEEECIQRVQHELRHSTVDVRYVPDISGLQLLNNSITEVAGFPVMNLSCTQMDPFNEFIKVSIDKLLAIIIVVILSPLLAAIAIGVKLTSPGPIFFRQRRLGAGGDEIDVIKFRSMVVHEEERGRVTQATKGDMRVTSFGAFLRRTSLDELPQFFNVLLGEMSIVGPRPHALEHNERYKELVDKYMLRHKVKPGITGWAQVNGFRGETDTVEKMAKRVEYDLQYIENWSLWLDFKIMALTVVRGFDDRNAY